MFTCIFNYFYQYFNFDYSPIQTKTICLKNTSNNSFKTNSSSNSSLDSPSYYSLNSSLDYSLNYSYKLIFSTSENTFTDIDLILNKFYNRTINTFNISSNSSIFHYNNKFYKISSILDINRYTQTLSSIFKSNINHIILPEHIYHNLYNSNEYIQIFPYFNQGDLFEYVTTHNLSITETLHIYSKCINIIKNLHNINIAHRDIKLENFLISTENNNLEIKLIDLDFSSSYNTHLHFLGGTPQYISYEAINSKSFKNWFSNDIWALGIILYTLLFNNFPWNNSLTFETYKKKNFKSNQYLKPCVLFEHYINNKHYEYWHKDLKNLSINKKIFTTLNIIFNYTFNLEWYNRNNIFYIEFLLNTINNL